MSLISFAADCVFVDWRHWAASIMSIISFAGDPSKGASGTSCAHEICPVLLVLCKDLASIMRLISSAADCVFRDLRHRAARITSINSFAADCIFMDLRHWATSIMSIISFAADCVFMDSRYRAASIMSIISLAGDPCKDASGTSRAHELCPVLLVLCKDSASIMSMISFNCWRPIQGCFSHFSCTRTLPSSPRSLQGFGKHHEHHQLGWGPIQGCSRHFSCTHNFAQLPSFSARIWKAS